MRRSDRASADRTGRPGMKERRWAMVSGEAVVLDDPVGASLRGPHARFARRLGRAATYLPGVATFSAVSGDPDSADWADLARLLGRGRVRRHVQPPGDPAAGLGSRCSCWRAGR